MHARHIPFIVTDRAMNRISSELPDPEYVPGLLISKSDAGELDRVDVGYYLWEDVHGESIQGSLVSNGDVCFVIVQPRTEILLEHRSLDYQRGMYLFDPEI